MSTSAPVPGTPLWWLRSATPDVVTLDAVHSGEHPDGTVVDVTGLPAQYLPPGQRVVRAVMGTDTRRMLEVQVDAQLAAGAPELVWFERLRRDLRPVVVHLQAFLYDDAAALASLGSVAPVRPGAVLTATDLELLGETALDVIGALRWNPATGQVLGVEVDPAHRRQRVATSLLAAGEACAVARGWPSLWAGGARTELGDELCRGVAGWGVRRVRLLTELLPEGATGLEPEEPDREAAYDDDQDDRLAPSGRCSS